MARRADITLVLPSSFKYICKHLLHIGTKGGSGEMCVLVVAGF